MAAGEEDQLDYLEVEDEQASLERIAAERKRRRAEILFKYAKEDAASPLPLVAKREQGDENSSTGDSKKRKLELTKGYPSERSCERASETKLRNKLASGPSTLFVSTDTERAGTVASAEYDERLERQTEGGGDMFSIDGGFDAGPAEVVASKGATERKVRIGAFVNTRSSR